MANTKKKVVITGKDSVDNRMAITQGITGRTIALEVLAKAKRQEAHKLAKGYQFVEVKKTPLTLAMKHPSEL